ncbi:4'-phosphopantetheinyl transferase family protein [Algoriphagus namhaensis]|uniref:4'-phosphopantetheinyl transferase family protein n=1 Tax=Algoriphagus namhaensis TaxID=915353 RepID=A0ABV8AUV7_9BACT
MQTKIEKIDASSALATKIIGEELPESLSFLSFREKLSMANISHPKKKQEWISSRLAIYQALDCLGLPYPGFYKDKHGKSQSMNGEGHVSLSHTLGLAAAIYHTDKSVGLDLEPIREKVVRIGPRFLSKSELDFLEENPHHYTMAWSAKESIFKCQGKRGVSFRENILLDPFDINSEKITGKIVGLPNEKHTYTIQVSKMENLILTYTIW